MKSRVPFWNYRPRLIPAPASCSRDEAAHTRLGHDLWLRGCCAMKVLFLLHQGNMYSGGQGVYTAQVTRELCDLGHEVHLVVGPPWPQRLDAPQLLAHRD